MSELIKVSGRRQRIRQSLLANVSLLAPLGYLGGLHGAIAGSNGTDAPIVWIELGGQAEQTGGQNIVLAPVFMQNITAAARSSILGAQNPSPFSVGVEGKITIAPHNMNWIISAAVRYGRSNSARHDHNQTAYARYVKQFAVNPYSHFNQPPSALGDGQTKFNESHTVIDFQAGKDVGLGLFGSHGSSVISAGVRFAQFTTESDAVLNARPNAIVGAKVTGVRHFVSYYGNHSAVPYQYYPIGRAAYAASLHARRTTRALGPSISWDASIPIAGNVANTALTVDWGISGALLFGRQRSTTHHQTTGYTRVDFTQFIPRGSYYGRGYAIGGHYQSYKHGPTDRARSRSVTIPNLGGFAGLSLKFPNAKISLGYRADFFFRATDSGIDILDQTNLSFNGPFATVSIGLGG